MRVSVARRRRWNNIIIIGVIAFMALLNLPSVIKTYLLDEPTVAEQHGQVLNPSVQVQAMHFTDWSVENVAGIWQSPQTLSIEPQTLVSRWQDLRGTVVDSATFEELKPNLGTPDSVEVWYVDVEEPQRITLYRLPQFWLLKNWQGSWVAVSVEPTYLLPGQ